MDANPPIIQHITGKKRIEQTDINIHFLILKNDGLSSTNIVTLYTTKAKKPAASASKEEQRQDIILAFQMQMMRQTDFCVLTQSPTTHYTEGKDCQLIEI